MLYDVSGFYAIQGHQESTCGTSRSFMPTPALEIIDDRIGPDQHFAEHRGEQHLEGPSLNAQSAPIAGGAG